MQPILELRSVSKTFGEGTTTVEALRGADLQLGRGEIVGIMGPSGSGKSTLLTIAGGLERPTAGEVLFEGADMGAATAKERSALRRSSIGFVFQDFNLLAGLTALENVAMPLELNGQTTKSANAAARAALEQVDLAGRTDHFPDDLSGGERQRVAIARSIVGGRPLLLADEPTGSLDSANAEVVMRILRNVANAGSAVMLVTHDAHMASWADRVVFIRDGRIVSESRPSGPETLIGSVGAV